MPFQGSMADLHSIVVCGSAAEPHQHVTLGPTRFRVVRADPAAVYAKTDVGMPP